VGISDHSLYNPQMAALLNYWCHVSRLLEFISFLSILHFFSLGLCFRYIFSLFGSAYSIASIIKFVEYGHHVAALNKLLHNLVALLILSRLFF